MNDECFVVELLFIVLDYGFCFWFFGSVTESVLRVLYYFLNVEEGWILNVFGFKGLGVGGFYYFN